MLRAQQARSATPHKFYQQPHPSPCPTPPPSGPSAAAPAANPDATAATTGRNSPIRAATPEATNERHEPSEAHPSTRTNGRSICSVTTPLSSTHRPHANTSSVAHNPGSSAPHPPTIPTLPPHHRELLISPHQTCHRLMRFPRKRFQHPPNHPLTSNQKTGYLPHRHPHPNRARHLKNRINNPTRHPRRPQQHPTHHINTTRINTQTLKHNPPPSPKYPRHNKHATNTNPTPPPTKQHTNHLWITPTEAPPTTHPPDPNHMQTTPPGGNVRFSVVTSTRLRTDTPSATMRKS